MDYRTRNRAAYNQLVSDGAVFSRVATDEECQRPLAVLDSRGWLPKSVQGKQVLCLAAGGGWQSILYATAGAQVTVVDLSPGMLALDDREARIRNLKLRLIEASMDDLNMLGDEQFDIVHHPVSTCYVPDLAPVFREVARVLRVDGVYISQHKSPISLQVTRRTERDEYAIGVDYYHSGPLPAVEDKSYREPGAVEFLHRYDQILGGMCAAGLVIEAFAEPKRAHRQATPGDFRHRGNYIAPYLRIKARKLQTTVKSEESSKLWTP